jgi:hypothetical protein
MTPSTDKIAKHPGYRDGLNLWSEGDARTMTHARACADCRGNFSDRCWCHGVTKHQNGDRRPDADVTDTLGPSPLKTV